MQLGHANRWPEIAQLNDLRHPNQIWVGQHLLLPPDHKKPTAPAHTQVYVVRKGDSLWKIAQTQLGNGAAWPQLARLNHLAKPDIYVGQHLFIPSSGAPTSPATNVSAAPPPPGGGRTGDTQFAPTSGINAAPPPIQNSGIRETQGPGAGSPATNNPQAAATDSPHPTAGTTPLLVAVKFEFDDKNPIWQNIPPITFSLGDFDVKVSFKGEIIVVDADQNSPLILTPFGRKVEYQQKSATAVDDVLKTTTVGIDASNWKVGDWANPPKPIIKTGFTFVRDKKTQFTVDLQYSPPVTLKGSIKPDWFKPFTISLYNHKFAVGGRIGIDIELTYNPKPRPTGPHPVPVGVPVQIPRPLPQVAPAPAPQPQPHGGSSWLPDLSGINWARVGQYTAGGLAIVGGVVLIGGSIVSNFATFGADTEVDAVTLPAGGSMISSGWAAFAAPAMATGS
jgi:LysM repeat protein